MNDTFYTGAIIFSFAFGTVAGAAAGWGFFGLMLMFGGMVSYFNNNPKNYPVKDKD
jgi:uncharacterized membrane-anchored protein